VLRIDRRNRDPPDLRPSYCFCDTTLVVSCVYMIRALSDAGAH